MTLEKTKGKIYKKKVASSEVRTSDLSFRSAMPITARPHCNLYNAAQNKVYKEMQICCYYYIISTSNYVSCFFLGFMFSMFL